MSADIVKPANLSLVDAREELNKIIQELCTTGRQKLDETKMKNLKTICKQNEAHVEICFNLLMTQLEKEHSEVRFSAFQIVDCLFERSHLFRELLLDQFQHLCELVLETNGDEPLPAPKKTANELKKLAARSIKNWRDKFADVYKLLELGFNYLKDCKRVDFVSFSHQSYAQRVHTETVSDQQQVFLTKKYGEHLQQMKDNEVDIINCRDQLERCINILIPKPEDLFDQSDFQPSKNTKQSIILPPTCLELEKDTSDSSDETDDDEEDEFVEVKSAVNPEEESIELRYFGFLGDDRSSEYVRNFRLNLDMKLTETEENKVVIDIMRDLQKELTAHLKKVHIWIKSFTSVRQGSENLSKAIDMKNSVQKILKQFDELKLSKKDAEEKKLVSATTDLKKTNDRPGTSRDLMADEPRHEPTEREIKRNEMLKIAPIIDLDEFQFGAPIVSKVETDHRYFARHENDLNEDLVLASSRLTKKTFAGKFEPVKWSCRAPIGTTSKLCTRMDRFKCPFHGKIVARDETGQIVNENDRVEVEAANKRKSVETNADKPWMDTQLIEDINAATGRNIQVVESKEDRKRKRGNKYQRGNKRKSAENEGNTLTDVDKEEDTTRNRLEKRLLDSKNMKKIGFILDSIEKRQNHQRFHHNFNYSLNS